MTPIKLEIMCIDKPNRDSPLERISRIGRVLPGGTDWSLSLDEAIQSIIDKRCTFFVNVNRNTVNVEIAERNGRKYLKTESD